ncbi:MAG: ABC transporter substrate-binding protein [Lachnospiraceae bacterium]|nr:ABC transporter substrate-binding protein [Lachnospiraceae bacterium]
MVGSLCGCGTSRGSKDSASGNAADQTDKTEITIVLDWTPNTNHTGLYVAEEKGYFADAGLQVSIVQPPDGGATDMVASGGAQFGIDFQDTLAAAFGSDHPLPITAVGAVLQHNTSGLVSLKKNGIDRARNLEGHSYATWDSPIEQAVLKNVVEEDGGDFGKVNLISTYVEDIVAGLNADIDSVWIYYGWDGIKLEQEGIDVNYLSLAEMNPVFDYYSPVIIGNDDFLQDKPEVAKAFLAAVQKGYEYAAEHPSDAAEILLKAVPELDEKLVQSSQEYVSKEYLAEADHWGVIDADRWNAYYGWLNEKKLVEQDIPENAGFDNSYLPE